MAGPVAEERLRELLHAQHQITSALELHEVLRLVVETAVELSHARYGALGVLAESGTGLSDFIHVGMDEHDVALIGELPRGRGLLGALVNDPRPLRTEHIGSHPLSSGFPPHHPPMTSFLGVPVRVHGTVFGNLYLTDHVEGAFSADDEQLVEALASTAGTAIANARLFALASHRARWSSVLSETAREAAGGGGDPVGTLMSALGELAGADLVCVVLAEQDDKVLSVAGARGAHAEEIVGRTAPAHGTLAARALVAGRPVREDSVDRAQVLGLSGSGPVLVAPFVGLQDTRGVLCLVRLAEGEPFLARDEEMVESFASHVAVALGQERLRRAQQRLTVIEDRSRIARDLHDHVIQRLYGAGLRLSALAGEVGDPAVAERIRGQVEEVDTTIAQIRRAIHALATDDRTSPRLQLARLVDEVAGFEVAPELLVTGPLDTVVDPPLLVDVLAVVREGLSNAVRHGRAQGARVEVLASGRRLEVTVVDDGSGLGEIDHPGGLSNLRERARRRGGALRVQDTGTGVTLCWWVPLSSSGAGEAGAGGEDG